MGEAELATENKGENNLAKKPAVAGKQTSIVNFFKQPPESRLAGTPGTAGSSGTPAGCKIAQNRKNSDLDDDGPGGSGTGGSGNSTVHGTGPRSKSSGQRTNADTGTSGPTPAGNLHATSSPSQPELPLAGSPSPTKLHPHPPSEVHPGSPSSRESKHQAPASSSIDLDANCWICHAAGARWRCTVGTCTIRYCCSCAQCGCAQGAVCTTIPVDFPCELCRGRLGRKASTKPVPRASYTTNKTVRCSRCSEMVSEWAECDTCGKLLCEYCSTATPTELSTSEIKGSASYRCLPCCCIEDTPESSQSGSKLLNGRAEYSKRREVALHRLWQSATGRPWPGQPTLLNENSKTLRATLKAKAGDCIAFCRVTCSLMKAGLEEVAKNALWAVKELNRLSACKPSVPLDLVYLQDGVNITWKSVEHAAASMAKELDYISCQKVKGCSSSVSGAWQ